MDLRVVWHLEFPVSLNTADIFERKSNLSWFRSILYGKFAEVPRELAQIIAKVFVAANRLV